MGLLMKEFVKQFTDPLKMIHQLITLKVIDEWEANFPKIVVLGEGSDGTKVISDLIGIKLPDSEIPVNLSFITTGSSEKKFHLEVAYDDALHERDADDESELQKIIDDLVKLVDKGYRSKLQLYLTVGGTEAILSNMHIILLPGISKARLDTDLELCKGYLALCVPTGPFIFVNVLRLTTSLSKFETRLAMEVLDKRHCHRLVTVFTKLDEYSQDSVTELTSNQRSEIRNPCGCYFLGDNLMDASSFKKTYPHLSHYDFLGHQALAECIILGMLSLICGPSSRMYMKIKGNISKSDEELKEFVVKSSDSKEETDEKTLKSIIAKAIVTIQNLFIRQDYQEYRNFPTMRAATQVSSLFKTFRVNLESFMAGKKDLPFLIDEIEIVNIPKPIGMPNGVLPDGARTLLLTRFEHAKQTMAAFVDELMEYTQRVLFRVLKDRAREYPQYHTPLTVAARMMAERLKEGFIKKLNDLVILETNNIFTSVEEEFSEKRKEMEKVKLDLTPGQKFVTLKDIGDNIPVNHLHVTPSSQLQAAFSLRIWMTVYWRFVVHRLVDYSALHFFFLMSEMLSQDIHTELKNYSLKLVREGDASLETTKTFAKASIEKMISELKAAKSDIENLQVKFEHMNESAV